MAAAPRSWFSWSAPSNEATAKAPLNERGTHSSPISARGPSAGAYDAGLPLPIAAAIAVVSIVLPRIKGEGVNTGRVAPAFGSAAQYRGDVLVSWASSPLRGAHGMVDGIASDETHLHRCRPNSRRTRSCSSMKASCAPHPLAAERARAAERQPARRWPLGGTIGSKVIYLFFVKTPIVKVNL